MNLTLAVNVIASYIFLYQYYFVVTKPLLNVIVLLSVVLS